MAIDTKETLHIAKLARIGLTDQELPKVTEKLNDILNWVDQLSEIDVENVEPLSAMTISDYSDQRDDVVTDGKCRDKLLKCAPDHTLEYYKVPKVVD